MIAVIVVVPVAAQTAVEASSISRKQGHEGVFVVVLVCFCSRCRGGSMRSLMVFVSVASFKHDDDDGGGGGDDDDIVVIVALSSPNLPSLLVGVAAPCC